MAGDHGIRTDGAECIVLIPPKRAILDDAMSILPVTAVRDPFRDFRGKRRREQIKLLIYGIFPIVKWIQQYSWKLFRDDLIAGLTIASLAVPQDLAYAKLAHLPSQTGLYSSLLPPYVYSVFGSSRQLAIGPVAVVSLLMGELLSKEFKPYLDNTGNPTENSAFEGTSNFQYVHFAMLTTFFTGLIQLSLGLFRLGFIIEYMSHSVVVGFMAGAAVTIAGSQLKGLLGYSNYTTKSNIESIGKSISDHADQFKWETFLLGMVFLTYLLIAKILAKKNKQFFYLAATGPLLSVVVSASFIKISGISSKQVRTVEKFERGLPPFSLKHFDWDLTGRALKVAVITAFVALTEAVAIGRSFAIKNNYHIDGSREMTACGFMNIASSLTSGYATTGSFSRSAVNQTAGAKTAVSNIVMATIILFTLLFLTNLFKYIPLCVLSAIIIQAVISLVDVAALKHIWQTDKLDFVALLGAFFGVIFINVEYGLLIAVGISLIKVVLHITWPRVSVLGQIPNTKIFRNVLQYPNATMTPGVLLARVDSSIYFFNCQYIVERVRELILESLEQAKKTDNEQAPVEFVVLEMSPVVDIDVTGIIALEDLKATLKHWKIELALANPNHTVLGKLNQSKFIEKLGTEWLFVSAAEAERTVSRLVKGPSALEGGRRGPNHE
eukprot:TRINITY_DN6809_c0_g2_i1.p1 TRINITY_DN6809_c0_g2~~TRINITY_DN6809_c0_g2_i1.p1  ORF type:complete len:665 (+),score=132.82 TRINITY_DN6809_c0_g2_i1:189-2183(+)